jgi:hypothetical protein
MIFFQTNSPANFASFVYDAIVMLGVGICQAQEEASKQLSQLDNNTSSHPVSIDRETLIRHMHNMTLQGASGPISPFPEDESYRNPNDYTLDSTMFDTPSTRRVVGSTSPF